MCGCLLYIDAVAECAGPQNEAEESGWKMVSGDVFRAPKDSLLLCVEVGSGVQIVSSAFITLVFAALGASVLTPSLPNSDKRRAERTCTPHGRNAGDEQHTFAAQGSCHRPAAARC